MIRRQITLLHATSSSADGEPQGAYVHNNLHIPPGTPLIRHELHISLKHYKSDNSNDEFYSQIGAAVAQGNVDAVVLYDMPEEPVDAVWQALSGAQPWHLEMEAAPWSERCFYEGLQLVTPPWSLKSLYLGSYHGYGYWNAERSFGIDELEGHLAWRQTSFPACYAGIETLILSCPDWSSCYFYPEGSTSSLRSLTIGKNEALRTLACTIACNPKLLHTLENLTIIHPNSNQADDDSDDVEYVRRFLGQSAIKSLELDLGVESPVQPAEGVKEGLSDEEQYALAQKSDPSLGIYSCLPKTLEFLSLRAPATKFTPIDLAGWITSASKDGSFPNLKKVAFSVEVVEGKKEGGPKPQERNLELMLEGKVEELLGIFTARGVEVVKPREAISMFHPLPLAG